jgi:eukaryotic-like serine/threonine-protein kinase
MLKRLLPAREAASFRSQKDVELLLRARLRAIATLFALANALLSAVGLTLQIATAHSRHFDAIPRQLFTTSPYFGWFLLVACVHAALAFLLASKQQLSLSVLRWYECIILAAPALLFANITIVELGSILRAAPTLAIILAMGLATPWIGMIVVLAVFIPNTWRRFAVEAGALLVVALAPDLVIVPRTGVDAFHASLFLAAKAIALAAAGVLSVYGAYRIEALREEAREARQLGQYVLHRLLGSGGMGEVYLAEHQLLRRPCAIKLIHPARGDDTEMLTRFDREVQATAMLTHPNTVQVFDFGRAEDGTLFYVMEYLPGLCLDDLVVRHGPVAPRRAVHFLIQLCGALQEAHANGLVHRDIKPSNVIVCERGGEKDVVKVLDFGIVTALGRDSDDAKITGAGVILGTPAFMSPEQCAGDSRVGPASDIYSLGVLAYYLLTARQPFAGRSPIQVIAAHLHETPPPMTACGVAVPEWLEAIVYRCLAKLPDDRFTSAAELRTALLNSATADQWTARDAADWWTSHAEVQDIARAPSRP